ncbi:RagB/SusD family nutrient uptake outer membrane protein [Spirosoma sp. BT702]|uniref:RagB/SusD family nutrient uptake outer membrane protein n=1 Tax=Spirosoma profusum TaxID=2771354 RepID=A0A927GAE5_9BACT|nr:RagB/SusD family nutrient uptake outer membrane protein [Spirosoma profusum]MBD2705368.1 RagB/SusD family nutrient uptake outer membrane protein [Spirosoma profusum]
MKKIIITSVLAGLLVLQNACTQEYLNPSTASQPQVVGSTDGLITVCNSLQYRYSVGGGGSVLGSAVSAGGLTTNELIVLNQGNGEEFALQQGQANVTSSNGVVRIIWTQSQLLRSNADLVLANTGVVTDPGTKSGIVAYASIFRALAIGTLAQFFQSAPIVTGENAPFVDRIDMLKNAIASLETAATMVTANPVSANFTGKVPAGIDIPNTLQALIARYALMAGDYDKALAAAAKVDLTKKSVFNFDDTSRNPIFFTAFGNVNVYAPTNTALGLPAVLAPNAADKRIAFYTQTANTKANLGTGFYTANNTPIPVYLPGEILLIQAEASARKGDLTGAVTALNKVLTKTAATDAFGVGAGLPAYSGAQTADAILLEILRNRHIELAFTGFRLEDSRRFNRPGPGAAGSERNRNFFPYPRVERENNTSTPATDPS